MIKYCLDKWNQNRAELENDLRYDKTLNDCDYEHLVKKIVAIILNGGTEGYGNTWDANKITVIDDGDYQGTLLFAIHKDTYQPDETEYLITFVGYGSCSGCDTLLAIQGWEDNKEPTEQQLKDYMALCKDIVCNMIKPYNYGWRSDPEFETVEME